MKKNTCEYCKFCFPDIEEGFVCAGENYGDIIVNSLDQIKECYSEGFEAFCERLDDEAVICNNEPIGDLKIDGRRMIHLRDLEHKNLRVKGSLIKEYLSDIPVIRIIDNEIYEVNVIFSDELFKLEL